MKWFRLWVDILDDPKMAQLTDYEFKIFIYLLALCSEVDSMSGECRLNVKSMSIRFRTQVNHLSPAFETFQKIGLITISEDGFVVISNWSKRQFKSDRVTDRVHKFRKVTVERNVSCNVSETPSDSDSDTDTDKTPSIPQKREEIIYPDWLNQEAWKRYLEHRKILKSKMSVYAQALAIKRLEGFKNKGMDHVAVLNQSIENGWKGLFELKIESSAQPEKPIDWICKKCHKKTNSLQAGLCHACYEG